MRRPFASVLVFVRAQPRLAPDLLEQPDIQAYIEKVAREHDLARYVRFNVEVLEQSWDDDAQLWRLDTSAGEITARFVVGAIGGLSDPALPDIPGLDAFAGAAFHSAEWDHSVSLEGKRVAVIGTGASGVQIVPRIQPQVGELQLFQRTPVWIMPRTDRPLKPFEHRLYRRVPAARRAVRAGSTLDARAVAIAFAKQPR